MRLQNHFIMPASKEQQRAKKYYESQAKKKREIQGVSREKFEEILEKFYFEYCPKHGFYRSISEAKKNSGYFIYPWQTEIAENYIRSVFRQQSMDLTISIMRQVGKTEMVALCTAFVFEYFQHYMGVPIAIAVFAPVKKTATIMFKRSTMYIDRRYISPDGDTKERKESIKGDTIDLFGIYDETKGSTVEGNTFDVIIRDEAHLGNDAKFNDEVEPTQFTKRGPLIRIGNGAKAKCDYYASVMRGDDYDTDTQHNYKLVRYTYRECRPVLEQLADRGLTTARTRIQKVDNYIKQKGSKNIDVLKNIYCKFVLEYGNVLTEDQIKKCSVEFTDFDPKKGGHLFMGVDIATLHDRTIATVMDKDRNLIDWIVVKERDTVAHTREQMEHLHHVCEERGYSRHFLAIGVDSTGLGAGGVVEILEEVFDCDIIPYHFSSQLKHDIYESAIESVSTDFIENRVKLPSLHPHYDKFVEEWVNLERHELPEKKFDTFRAPKGMDKFDDFCASYAIVWDLRAKEYSYYDLNDTKDDFKPIPAPVPYVHYTHYLTPDHTSENQTVSLH